MTLELFIAAQAVFDAARFNRRPTGELDVIAPAEPVLRLGKILGQLAAHWIEVHRVHSRHAHPVPDTFKGDSNDH